MQNQDGYTKFVLRLCDIVKAHVNTFYAGRVGLPTSHYRAVVTAATGAVVASNSGQEASSTRW